MQSREGKRRKLMTKHTMTNAQLNEAEKVLPLLNECREHLDNARFRMGEIDDDSFIKLSTMYDYICKALDLA